MPTNDLKRLKQEYVRRANDPGKDYSPTNPVQAFIISQRQKALQKILTGHHIEELSSLRILEIGCGRGGVLSEFIELGAKECNLYGIDILPGRLNNAHSQLPLAKLINADGQRLPYLPESFDLVMQFTAFSSILDPHVKHHMAGEMLRVLKTSGALIWYDFWWNPLNNQTRGIGPTEIRGLFPGCHIKLERVTLAPPVTKIILPLSHWATAQLESLKVFNSHFIGIIRKIN